MKKMKIDRYLVYEKGREYEILKFPFIKYMWAYEDAPDTDLLLVDGGKEAFSQLKYAYAVLANHPDVLIYFPCKQDGIGDYYIHNYHLVLCRPELQFRRSLWPRIRKKLNKKHEASRFVLSYNRKKLDDYYEKGLWKNYKRKYEYGKSILSLYPHKKKWEEARNIREILGDTIFMVFDRVECHIHHYRMAKDLDDFEAGNEWSILSSIGWIVSDKRIRAIKMEQK